MVFVKGKYYYSCNEIAKAFNNDDERFSELLNKFRKVYHKGEGYFFTDVYIQSKLYKATDKNLISHVSYKKNKENRSYKGYSIEDVMKFLDRPEAPTIGQCDKVYDVKIYEVEI